MEPARIVRVYGKAGLLFGLMTAFLRTMASAVGVTVAASSEARVIPQAERDAQRMLTKGYQVVSSEWYAMPLGLGYLKVVYELTVRR